MNDRIDGCGGAGVARRPLLATNSVNVRYLTGFDSSNAAVLVDGDHVLVATDGRYAEAARALEGAEPVESDRDIFGFLGTRLGELVESPIAFESDFVTVAAHGAPGERLDARPGQGRRPRARQGGRRARRHPRGRTRDERRVCERSARESVIAGTEADVAWWFEKTLRDEARTACVPGHRRRRSQRGAPAPSSRRLHDRARGDHDRRRRRVVIGYCSDCRARSPRASSRAALQGYDPAVPPRRTPWPRCARARGGSELDAIARDDRGVRSGARARAHGLGHGLGLDVHELPARALLDGHAVAGNVVTVEPGVYFAGLGGHPDRGSRHRRRGWPGSADDLHEGSGHPRLASRPARGRDRLHQSVQERARRARRVRSGASSSSST